MTHKERFDHYLHLLTHWHTDSMRAQNFSGPQTCPTKAGSVVFQINAYPFADYWRNRWRLAKNAEQREEAADEIQQEYEGLTLSPSRKYTFSQRTLEWKVAIGTCELPAKHTARLYGVGLSTVYKYRKEHA